MILHCLKGQSILKIASVNKLILVLGYKMENVKKYLKKILKTWKSYML